MIHTWWSRRTQLNGHKMPLLTFILFYLYLLFCSGDTLIFDALQNRLYIDDGNDNYHALCFRDYQKDCEQCVGFETGHECSDAGYCMSNQCSCDMGFSGTACQNARNWFKYKFSRQFFSFNAFRFRLFLAIPVKTPIIDLNSNFPANFF